MYEHYIKTLQCLCGSHCFYKPDIKCRAVHPRALPIFDVKDKSRTHLREENSSCDHPVVGNFILRVYCCHLISLLEVVTRVQKNGPLVDISVAGFLYLCIHR